MTALAMIVADELEVDWKRVVVKQVETDDTFENPLLGAQVTAASGSTRGFLEPLRKAGAAGRALFVRAADQLWRVPEEEGMAQLEVVRHIRSNKRMTYGKLVELASQSPFQPMCPSRPKGSSGTSVSH